MARVELTPRLLKEESVPSSRGNQRLQRTDARRNADRLRQAAAELFEGDGFSTRMEDVARRAGLSVGTLYNLFGGRAGLVAAVVFDLAQARLQATLTMVKTQPDAWSRFAAFVRGLCELLQAGPSTDADASRQYVDAARALAVSEYALSVGEELIQAAHRDGSLRQDFGRDDLLQLLWSHGSLVLDQVGNDEGWRRSTRHVLDGLQTPGNSKFTN